MLRSITAFRGIARACVSRTRDLSSTKAELKQALRASASKLDNIGFAEKIRVQYIADPGKKELVEGQHPSDARYWKNLCLPLAIAHANALIDSFPVDLCLARRLITLTDNEKPSRHVSQFYSHYFLMIEGIIYDPSYLQFLALEEKLKKQPLSVNCIAYQGIYIDDQPPQLQDYFETRAISATGIDLYTLRSDERVRFDKSLRCLSPSIRGSLKPILLIN